MNKLVQVLHDREYWHEFATTCFLGHNFDTHILYIQLCMCLIHNTWLREAEKKKVICSESVHSLGSSPTSFIPQTQVFFVSSLPQ